MWKEDADISSVDVSFDVETYSGKINVLIG